MDNFIWLAIVTLIVIVALCKNWLKVLILEDKIGHLEHQVDSDENIIDYLQRKVEELSRKDKENGNCNNNKNDQETNN